jgi:hypothetical protein
LTVEGSDSDDLLKKKEKDEDKLDNIEELKFD